MATNLAGPLTKIINRSLTEGVFPTIWKQAIVTPILKKGDAKDKTNYRPVSCLMVLSKVLEKIVFAQITEYMEKNKLIPDNQHGFRKGRSTMSALFQTKGSTLTNDSFIYDATRLWNMAPESIKMSKSLLSAKAEIKKFCVSLPLRLFNFFSPFSHL